MFTKTVKLFLFINFFIFTYIIASESEEFYKKEAQLREEAYSKYSGPLHNLIGSFIQRMEQELGLTFTGEGGSFGKTIDWLLIKFDVHRRATVEEARALELYLIDVFAHMLNSNQIICPYLIEYPISHKNIMISLSFVGPLGRNAEGIEFLLNGPGSGIYEDQNTLTYYAFDPLEYKHDAIYEETYEDAVRLAKSSAIDIPFKHQTTEREIALDDSLIPFTKKIAQEQQFECWGIGCHEPQIKEIRAKFVLVRHVTQEDARKLTIYVADNLIEHLNRNDKLTPFLAESPFSSRRLKFRIEFVKRNYCPFTDGSMESVIMEDNLLTYYYRVPEPEKGVDEEYWMFRTTLLAKETYDEAKHLASVKPPSLLTRLLEKTKSLFSR